MRFHNTLVYIFVALESHADMARASPTQDWSQSNEYIKGRFETSALNSGSPPAANEASVYDAKRSVADDDELEIQQAPPEWLTNFNEYVTFIGLFSGCAYTAVWVSRKLYMTWTSQEQRNRVNTCVGRAIHRTPREVEAGVRAAGHFGVELHEHIVPH